MELNCKRIVEEEKLMRLEQEEETSCTMAQIHEVESSL